MKFPSATPWPVTSPGVLNLLLFQFCKEIHIFYQCMCEPRATVCVKGHLLLSYNMFCILNNMLYNTVYSSRMTNTAFTATHTLKGTFLAPWCLYLCQSLLAMKELKLHQLMQLNTHFNKRWVSQKNRADPTLEILFNWLFGMGTKCAVALHCF